MHKHLSVNHEGRDFVVGDLHGSLCLLEGLLDHVQFNKSTDRLISVGDLVDRGPDSLGCLRLLRQPWFHAVMGNHEDLMLNFLAGNPIGNWWFPNGGNWWHSITPELREEVTALCKEAVQHLPFVITVEQKNGRKFHVVHAEFASDEELTDENLPELLPNLMEACSEDGPFPIWGRSLFLRFYAKAVDQRDIDKFRREAVMFGSLGHFHPTKLGRIFSGHTIVRQPLTIGHQTNLDTGAFAQHKHDWAGLTICEPATNTFWTTNGGSVRQVNDLVIV